MKKISVLNFILVCIMSLCGCSSTAVVENITDGNKIATVELADSDKAATPSEDTQNDDSKRAAISEESVTAANDDSLNVEVVETPQLPTETSIDFKNIAVCFDENGETAQPITLNVVSEKDNKISAVQDWFVSNKLFLPMLSYQWADMITPTQDFPTVNADLNLYGNAFYDENYIYEWNTSYLNIYDRASNQLLHTISYETEQWYLMGNCACLQDGILYIGYLYNGYAMPNTCYLLAYDIENEKVLWRSEDQTFNTMNFIVKDDIILCGYGFTAEKDYLYQLDKNTGKVISKTELKKMPDLLVEKDGQLYVHTYSYDYVFEME